jgi:hypothetical protein
VSHQGENDLAALAEKIRVVYWQLLGEAELRVTGQVGATRPRKVARWDGGQDASGRRYKPIWPRLADYFIQNGVSPEDAIRAVFDRYVGGPPPAPNQVMVPDVVSLVEERKAKRAEHIRYSVESERTAFQDEACFQERIHGKVNLNTLRELITSPWLNLTPLFRFCLSVRHDFRDLAQFYEDKAFAQYLNHPLAYEAVWRGWIPASFGQRLAGMQSLSGTNRGRSL